MDGAVVAKLLREPVLLAARAQAEEDAVEGPLGIGALAPVALGGSSSLRTGSTSSHRSSGTSQMVAKLSCSTIGTLLLFGRRLDDFSELFKVLR
jgi:hypothetical protein